MMKRLDAFWVWVVLYGVLVVVKHGLLWDWWIAWWAAGLVMALLFPWFDRLVYVYGSRPHEQLSLQVQFLLRSGRWGEAIRLLILRKDEQMRLSTQNVVFAAVWVAAAAFVVSSTTNWLAKGLVMGIGLHMFYDMLSLWSSTTLFKERWFWQIKRTVGDAEARAVVWVFAAVLAGLSVIV